VNEDKTTETNYVIIRTMFNLTNITDI